MKPEFADLDPYKAAKDAGVYCELTEDPSTLTLEKIALRVKGHKEQFEAKVAKKQVMEERYYENREGGTDLV